MRNLKLQNILIFGVLLYVIISVVISVWPQKHLEEVSLVVPAPKAEIEGREDLQSRREYEQQMLVNPQAGVVPVDIRTKELKFANVSYQTQLLDEQPRTAGNTAGTRAFQSLIWNPVGPNNFGGRTRALGMDVRDENTLIAGGVSGGIWRSTNQGSSWTRITIPEEIQSVTALTQNIKPGQEDIWYYGTGEWVGNSSRAPGAPFRGNGIYKSVDNGVTWQALASTQSNSPGFFNSPFQYIWDITTNPNGADDEVLAAVFGGIVRSTDGGQTWTTVLGNDLLDLPLDVDLNQVDAIFYTDIHRTSNGTLVASLGGVTNRNGAFAPEAGTYISTDGVNWTRVLTLVGATTRRIEVGSSASNPDVLYIVADQITDYALWRYTISTQQLIRLSANVPNGSNNIEAFDSQSSYNLMVTVHPTQDNVVYLGATNLYRSTDGFSTNQNISWIGGYDPEEDGARIYPGHHPDQHGILFIPSDPNKMISYNDGGLFLTDDNLAQNVEYSSLNNGFVTTQFYTGVFSKYPPDDFVIGGTQDNGSLLATNDLFSVGDNGTRVLAGDGGFAATTPIGVFYYMSFQNSRMFRLTLNQDFEITSFARVDPVGGGSNPSQPYLFVNPYVLDPNNTNRMYLAGGDFLWRNRNLSQILTGSQNTTSVNWNRLEKTELPSGQITAVQASTTPENIVFYGTSNGRLFKITDANTDIYEVLEITSNSFPADGYIRSIAIDPENANEVMVGFSNYGVQSIFRSTDGGDSFTDVSGNLEESPDGTGNGPSVRWVTIVPKTDGSKLYFAATSTGLYSTTTLDGLSTSWQLEAPDVIGNTVVNMVDYRRFDGKVVAATHGRGMFTSRISDVVPSQAVDGSAGFTVNAIYPNPFSNLVTINIDLPETNFLLIRIYDAAGNQIRTISSGLGFIGENEFFWDGTNTFGRPVPDGVYLIRITYRDENTARRVLLNRG